MLRNILSIIAILVLFNNTQAGWVITETNTSPNDVQLQAIYMQDNIIKIPGEQETMIMDLENGILTFILENHKVYWRGPMAEFIKGMVITLEKQLEIILPQIPEEERAAFENRYRQQIKIYSNDSTERIFPGEVTSRITAKTKTIEGYHTSRYDIFVDSLLVEEIWLTEEINPFSEIDYTRFNNMLDGITLSGKIDYRRSSEYIKVILSGYPMQSIKHIGDETLETVVTSIKEKDLPSSTFEPPGNYEEMSIEELMSLILGN